MAADERARHELYQQAEAAMSRESADTLMELLPPVGWADVATKQDLVALGDRLEARIMGAMHKELNAMLLKMFALVVALLGVVAALVVPLAT
jgi:hypothetical protein